MMKTLSTYRVNQPTTTSGHSISITTTFFGTEKEVEYIKQICAETIGSGLVQEYDSSLTMPFSVLNQNKVVPDECKSCKGCKYYLWAFEGFPCVNCCRNFKLVDEIREQKNDLWKDGTKK